MLQVINQLSGRETKVHILSFSLKEATSVLGSAFKMAYSSLGGQTSAEPQRPTSPKIDRAKNIIRRNVRENQHER